jgi:pilus assembly protein CpaC
MKRFIEITVALAVILGAAGAHAQDMTQTPMTQTNMTQAQRNMPQAGMPNAGIMVPDSSPQVAEMAPVVAQPPVHRSMAPPVFAIPVANPPALNTSVEPRVVAAQPAVPRAALPTPVAAPQDEAAVPAAAPMHVTFSPQAGAVAQDQPMPMVVMPPGYVAAAPVPLPMPAPEMTGQTPITLEAGTGTLLRLPAAAATIMSAQPTIARVQPASPTSLFVMGVGPGRTTVIAASRNGLPIAQYDVTVTPGLSSSTEKPAAPLTSGPPPEPTTVTPALAASAQAAINQSVVGAQSVKARATGHALLLTGTVATAQIAQSAASIAQAYIGPKFDVDNEMAVLGSIQVNVRVRIAEIDRTITRQLGFNWQAFGNAAIGNGAFQLGSLVAPLANLTQATAFASTATSSNWDINGVIDALAQDQLVSILAEPNLTAQSGETASFLAGGEFPVPVSAESNNGTPTVTVAFKQFGVSLALVPTVLSPNRLNLRIRPEVSQLSTQGEVSVPLGTGTVTIPALSVRRAETTIELGSGQSFAIAGLLQKTTTDLSNAVPGLGELPILGPLFKSTAFQHGESELVIIVTPYIVRPVSDPTALRAPTDHYQPATDLDRILFGRQLARTPGGVPALDAGFILK